MKVLVISKTTNLELHGDIIARRVATGIIDSTHMERLQRAHDDHYRTLDHLYEQLLQAGIKYLEIGRGLYWPQVKNLDAVITVGGDGTVLEASHRILDDRTPLIGVRSSPLSVGYLCYCNRDEINTMVQQLIEDKLPVVSVNRLRATVKLIQAQSSVETPPILNDLLFCNLFPAATTRYGISFGGKREEHKSSGIWVSTAAGSSAAIHAAGGETLPFHDDRAQFLVRELYEPAGKSFTLRKSVFRPEVEPLVIENHCETALLAVDGQRGTVNLSFGDKIIIKRNAPLTLAKKKA